MVETRVRHLGLSDLVTVCPWLSGLGDFQAAFSSAAVVVFPSEFEGFGLPAVEAMRLGIPVVVTPEPALLEVTQGHATVMGGDDDEALAAAISTARWTAPQALEAARTHAGTFTWRSTAERCRALLADVVCGKPVSSS